MFTRFSSLLNCLLYDIRLSIPKVKLKTKGMLPIPESVSLRQHRAARHQPTQMGPQDCSKGQEGWSGLSPLLWLSERLEKRSRIAWCGRLLCIVLLGGRSARMPQGSVLAQRFLSNQAEGSSCGLYEGQPMVTPETVLELLC